MIKQLTLLFIVLFSVSSIYAQRGTVKGKVVSTQGNPIENVDVLISKTQLGTTTNTSGEYSLNNIEYGSYILVISYVGFETKEVSVNVNSNNVNVPTIMLQQKEEQLQEVVVEAEANKYSKRNPSSSLRLKTELVKLPQNIQVVSGELLADQQVVNIMEVATRNVSGATMIEHWGHFARINMRGFRIPAFRNGFNVSDTWGPLAEDMNNVERIEFVKGPSGFMMAAGEPGGFYNVVTKKPSESFIANVSLTAGSFDFYRGTIDVGGKLTEDGKLLARFNAMYQTSDTHRGGEQADKYAFAPSITYNVSDNTSLTAELNYQNVESFIGSAYVFGTVEDGYGSLDRDFRFIDTNYPASDIDEVSFFTNFKHAFSDNWSFEAQYAYLKYNQEGYSQWLWSFDETTGDAYRYTSVWDALSIGNYFQAYLYGNFNTGGLKHNVLAGFDYTDKAYWADFYQFGLADINQPFNIYNPEYGISVQPEFNRSQSVRNRNGGAPYNGFTNRAFYVQDEISFLDDQVRLTLAGRYTNLSTIGKLENDTKFTPRVGLSVDVMPTLTAYALYDQSFLANFGLGANGESFDPAEGNDIEGGLKKSFFDGRLNASLGGFLITKQNVLTADPENPNFSIALGEVQSKGIEFDLQGQITPELNVVFNYANTNVEITEDTDQSVVGQRVAGHAKHMTNGWFNYNFANDTSLQGFGASLGYQYQVDRSSWSWNADNDSVLPDYFRLDGALSWKGDKMRIQLNVNNILDEYLYSGSAFGNYLYWQSEPGINGRITVSYNF